MKDEHPDSGPRRSEAERRVAGVRHLIIKPGEGKEMPGEEMKLGVWDTVDGVIRELRERARKIDLGEVLGRGQLLMLGENHGDREPVEWIGEKAQELYGMGVRYCLIEALTEIQPKLDLLNAGEGVVLAGVELGPDGGRWRPEREEMVRKLAKVGVGIYAIDPGWGGDSEAREAGLCNNAKRVMGERIGEKGMVLIGGGHLNTWDRSLAGRLVGEWSLSRAWVVVDSSLRQKDPFVWMGVEETGRVDEAFMVDVREDDLKGSHYAYKLESDWWIYLPRKKNG